MEDVTCTVHYQLLVLVCLQVSATMHVATHTNLAWAVAATNLGAILGCFLCWCSLSFCTGDPNHGEIERLPNARPRISTSSKSTERHKGLTCICDLTRQDWKNGKDLHRAKS